MARLSFVTDPAMDSSAYLREHIRTVPNWPAPGVQFRDITPLLQNPKVFRVLIDTFVHRYMDPALRPTVVAGLTRAASSSAPSWPTSSAWALCRSAKRQAALHHGGRNLRTRIRQRHRRAAHRRRQNR